MLRVSWNGVAVFICNKQGFLAAANTLSAKLPRFKLSLTVIKLKYRLVPTPCISDVWLFLRELEKAGFSSLFPEG